MPRHRTAKQVFYPRVWWMPEEVTPEQVIACYASGLSFKKVAELLGTLGNSQNIWQYFKDYDIPIRRRGPVKLKNCLGCGFEIDQYTISQNKHGILCETCAPNSAWVQRFCQFGVTKPQFEEMLRQQSGLCDMCETELSSDPKKIAIDHCHKQGHVRSLLCNRCNTGLGFVEDDKFLANAIRYIERHKR